VFSSSPPSFSTRPFLLFLTFFSSIRKLWQVPAPFLGRPLYTPPFPLVGTLLRTFQKGVCVAPGRTHSSLPPPPPPPLLYPPHLHSHTPLPSTYLLTQPSIIYASLSPSGDLLSPLPPPNTLPFFPASPSFWLIRRQTRKLDS